MKWISHVSAALLFATVWLSLLLASLPGPVGLDFRGGIEQQLSAAEPLSPLHIQHLATVLHRRHPNIELEVRGRQVWLRSSSVLASEFMELNHLLAGDRWELREEHQPTASLSNEDLLDVRVEDGDFGLYRLRLVLTPTGAERLAVLSTANVGKKLEFWIGSKLVMAPEVREPVTGGELSLSPGRDQTRAEYERLADSLLLGEAPLTAESLTQVHARYPRVLGSPLRLGLIGVCWVLGLVGLVPRGPLRALGATSAVFAAALAWPRLLGSTLTVYSYAAVGLPVLLAIAVARWPNPWVGGGIAVLLAVLAGVLALIGAPQPIAAALWSTAPLLLLVSLATHLQVDNTER